ncbi:mannitol-1-phosphate 5-dehydrogenase [Mesomycoplasma ovipneumoniae]|uniref:mannitol-1-phosphate 5-dehydrogenase n=1 Tax=Mesomycoplasma ovipneumoniae TaxID=29562 RepID=UPI0026E37C37|nr:mannitol-1-phosphate 5-dehydrogenase [Mesomycoplasma ovipneumoniae]MDO6857016.1 mannitol-1-phosphate 5-dehydrogenase [Mesomycoplasma ovipneumoniae]
MKVVHFGAGNIGRGLIAKLYQENQFEIIFVDVNDKLINELNQKGFYYVINFENGQKYKVRNYFAINLSDEKKLLMHLKNADLISTSVGSENLIHLRSIFAKLAKIEQKSKQIICFENGFRVSSNFKKSLENCKFWQFVDTTIDQIAPSSTDLNVYTETYSEIIIKEENQKIKLKGVKYLENLDYFILRKLFFVNTLHSGIAYLAYILKYNYIHEALNSPVIQKYISQLKIVLIKVLSFQNTLINQSELEKYFEKTIKRFENPILQDSIIRVARNPITKIGKNERFNLLLKYAKIAKLEPKELEIIYRTFANILNYDSKQDIQAIKMQENLVKDPEKFLKMQTNLEDFEIKTVLKFYDNIKGGKKWI